MGSSRKAAIVAMSSDCGLLCAAGAAGAALKLDANNIAEAESRATERVIWSAEARAELFWRFFILFFLAIQAQFLPMALETRTLFVP